MANRLTRLYQWPQCSDIKYVSQELNLLLKGISGHQIVSEAYIYVSPQTPNKNDNLVDYNRRLATSVTETLHRSLQYDVPLVGGCVDSLLIQSKLPSHLYQANGVGIRLVTSERDIADGKQSVFYRKFDSPQEESVRVGRFGSNNSNGESSHSGWSRVLGKYKQMQAPSAERQSSEFTGVHSLHAIGPHSQLNALCQLLKRSPNVLHSSGIASMQTRFLTGTETVLIANDQVYTDGVVGICSELNASSPQTKLPWLCNVSRQFQITKRTGNMIIELDNEPAVSVVQQLGLNSQFPVVALLPDLNQLPIQVVGGDSVRGVLGLKVHDPSILNNCTTLQFAQISSEMETSDELNGKDDFFLSTQSELPYFNGDVHGEQEFVGAMSASSVMSSIIIEKQTTDQSESQSASLKHIVIDSPGTILNLSQ
ncbi:hypothetical protein MP228_012167 [Amoeboaphelidium protococcarum]|nr:hypothetical protein MP228_012167 [Amoeboaphelidium protococcarum]